MLVEIYCLKNGCFVTAPEQLVIILNYIHFSMKNVNRSTVTVHNAHKISLHYISTDVCKRRKHVFRLAHCLSNDSLASKCRPDAGRKNFCCHQAVCNFRYTLTNESHFINISKCSFVARQTLRCARRRHFFLHDCSKGALK